MRSRLKRERSDHVGKRRQRKVTRKREDERRKDEIGMSECVERGRRESPMRARHELYKYWSKGTNSGKRDYMKGRRGIGMMNIYIKRTGIQGETRKAWKEKR